MKNSFKNEIFLWLEENLITKEVPPDKIVSSLSRRFELSGFDSMMVYSDWTFNTKPMNDKELMDLEEELDQESLDWERMDSENE
tara:strand:+ start:542 stop:793 length:252 start_codon:yes stop_codon:yes gene_type:complete